MNEESKRIRAITAQLFVAKNMKNNPIETIKFIRDNKEFFPGKEYHVLINKIIQEKNITEDQINCIKDMKI